jgi:2,4-dienoyl-CoA reductase-like NADH-dependent reductase (Old Yellow Enzyme family)
MSPVDVFFEPYDLAGLTLDNRIVMAPLTRMRASEQGVLSQMHAEYYAQRATAGLIVAEGTFPHHSGKSYPGQPGLETAEQIAGWRLITDAVHASGGKIFVQVMHGGRISHPKIIPGGLTPVAPSVVQPDLPARIAGETLPIPPPRALELSELAVVQEQFANASANAIEAGFDGIELHSANGYLLHQFLSDVTNLRDDGYGGDAEGRTRFVIETAALCAERIGADRVGIRISPNQMANDISETDSLGTYPVLLKELAKLKLAFVHVLETPPDTGWSAIDLVRVNWPGTLIANSNFLTNWEPDEAAALLEGGRADLYAYGRRFIANPDLVERIRIGAPLNEADPKTFYGGGAEGYTDYPTLAAGD